MKKQIKRFMPACVAFGIAVLVVLNILFNYLSLQNTALLDSTPEGLYSLSSTMVEECTQFFTELKQKDPNTNIKITFCNDPDKLMSSRTTRAVYYMALRLRNMFKNLEIECVNVLENPTAVSQYKTTSLDEITISDIIVSYGDRYRIVGADNFWTVGSSGSLFSFNGEYKLVTLMYSVSSVNAPAAYFIVGHGETVYNPLDPTGEDSRKLSAFYDLLTQRGLDVKTLDITDPTLTEIPSDAVLLIINDPKSDYVPDSGRLDEFGYVSQLEIIDRYLINKSGALMVAKDHKVSLPNLEELLSEWGFKFDNYLLEDEKNAVAGDKNTVKGNYNTSEDSYGYAIYGDFASLGTAPVTVYKNTGSVSCSFGDSTAISEPGSQEYISRNYSSFMTSSDRSRLFDTSLGVSDLKGGYAVRDLAAVCTREKMDAHSGEYTYSYVFATNSNEFFTNTLIGSKSYANYDIVSSLVDNMSRTDVYASLNLGGTSLNSSAFGGKQLVSTTLSEVNTNVYAPDGSGIVHINNGFTSASLVFITVVVCIAPITLVVLGIVCAVKRRFL